MDELNQAGKGSGRRDNFKAFNQGLYFWLKDHPGLIKTESKCECGGFLYENPVILKDGPPQKKRMCRCGHEEYIQC